MLNEELSQYINEAQYKYESSAAYRRRADYYTARNKYDIDDKTILYEAFYGRAITCNPGALFRYLLKDDRFKDYTHVWVLEDSDFRQIIMDAFRKYPNVIFIEPFTDDYYKYLSTAKYLINNSTWQTYFAKKDGQVIVNTWHGIPLKYLAFDEPNSSITASNMLRNFLMTDYIISPVSYTTDNFRNAFKLDGIFPGKIIESGYPRIDETYHSDKPRVSDVLKRFGVNYNPDKKLILYAPTWRGASFGNPNIDIEPYEEFVNTVYKFVDKNEYQVLAKPHQIVYKSLVEKGILKDYFVPATVDTNELLGVTDILISDYSSIFFDFLVTGRPLLFYVPDLKDYSTNRGLYFSVDDLPGPVSDSLEQVAQWLSRIDEYDTLFDKRKYQAAIDRFVYNDDGNVCERVIDAVFFGDESNTVKLENDKKKILFHTDKILANGISTSMLNLLNNMDCSKYDVSFYAIGANNAATRSYLEKIKPEVRVIYRNSASIIDVETDARKSYCIDNGIVESDHNALFPLEFYQTEYKRCFGDADFDYLINFSGFNAFWANIYLTHRNAKKFIWMHNVMEAEYNRVVDGKPVFKRELDNIYKLYNAADKYVSCSKTTMLCNRDDLATDETYNRFAFMHNLIDYKRVYDSIENCNEIVYDGKKYLAETVRFEDFTPSLTLVPKPNNKCVSFVTVGRLADAKNHINLIKAFSKINKENKNTRLYIIGDGPNLAKTRQLISKLKLEGKVILTGNMLNPFALLKECDCFILPSYYEGQPMVILEARILGLPIIVSNFDTVADSSYENGQLVIGTDENDIYNGLKSFLDGDVPNEYHFDPIDYNEKCLKEFEALME